MTSRKELKVLVNRQEIESTVKRLAGEINRDYKGKPVLLVGVLKGAFIFLADLVRQLDIPIEVDFIGVSSYGTAQESSGEVKITKCLSVDVKSKDVMVIEDIIDTGLTTSFIIDYLNKQKPASLKVCTLADKPSRRKKEVEIDYLGFEVPDRFVVGYGLDFDEKYRQLPDICYLEDE